MTEKMERIRILVEEHIGPGVDSLRDDLEELGLVDQESVSLAISLASELVKYEMYCWLINM